jgi:hypothetical protein
MEIELHPENGLNVARLLRFSEEQLTRRLVIERAGNARGHGHGRPEDHVGREQVVALNTGSRDEWVGNDAGRDDAQPGQFEVLGFAYGIEHVERGGMVVEEVVAEDDDGYDVAHYYDCYCYCYDDAVAVAVVSYVAC